MVDIIESIVGEQKLVKFIKMALDKNGKLIFGRDKNWKAANKVNGFGTADPAGANDISLVEIEVEAGEILEIYHITCTSETGAKGIQIATTTAVFAAPLSGVAGYTQLWAALITGTQVIADQSKEPFLIVDNSEGSASVYLHLAGITGFMDTVQANGEDLAGFLSGYKYTP